MDNVFPIEENFLRIGNEFIPYANFSSFIIIENVFSRRDVDEFLEKIGASYTVFDLSEGYPPLDDEDDKETMEIWNVCEMPGKCENYLRGVMEGKFSFERERDFEKVLNFSRMQGISFTYDLNWLEDIPNIYVDTLKYCTLCKKMGLAKKRKCSLAEYGFTLREQLEHGKFFLYGKENANAPEVMIQIKEHFHIPDALAVFHRQFIMFI